MGDYADHNGVGHNMTPAQVDRFVEQQRDRPTRPLGSKPYCQHDLDVSPSGRYATCRLCGFVGKWRDGMWERVPPERDAAGGEGRANDGE